MRVQLLDTHYLVLISGCWIDEMLVLRGSYEVFPLMKLLLYSGNL